MKRFIFVIMLLLTSTVVTALLADTYYDYDYYNNYPYGLHNFSYSYNSWVSTYYDNFGKEIVPTGSSWDVSKLLGICNTIDCSTIFEQHIFSVFLPKQTTVNFNYASDDHFLIIDADTWTSGTMYCDDSHIYYSMTGITEYFRSDGNTHNNVYGGSMTLPAGWTRIDLLWCERGGEDYFSLWPKNSSGDTGKYYSPFTAISLYQDYKMHLNEGSQVGDCNDGIDNDGDWNSNFDLSNDGVAADGFNVTKYSSMYPISKNGKPDFGESNVDCFEQKCDGQYGPTDYSGHYGKCNWPTSESQPKEYSCNDNYDNDFDGLTDMADPDCYSVQCPASNFALQTNSAAMNGSDGCCGDDRIIDIASFCSNYDLFTCSYVRGICQWKSLGFASGTCIPNSTFLSNPYALDYGYIDPSKKNLCYNKLSEFSSPADLWSWISATSATPLKIYVYNQSVTGLKTDIISNSENWSYCNADGTNKLNGLGVADGQSFGSPIGQNINSMSCTLIAQTLDKINNWQTCTGPTDKWCCDGLPVNTLKDVTYTGPPNGWDTCRCRGSDPLISSTSLCDFIPNAPGCSIQSASLGTSSSSEVLKMFCKEGTCLSDNSYDATKKCDMQFDANGKISDYCTKDQVCVNGIVLPTADTNITFDRPSCCFGDSTRKCVDKTSITTNICTDNHGTVMDITPGKMQDSYCFPNATYVQISTNDACCFGKLEPIKNMMLSYFTTYTNTSFLCYKEDGNNYFAECCWSDNPEQCHNADISSYDVVTGKKYLVNMHNRIFSEGMTLHTLNAFDYFNSARGGIIEDAMSDIKFGGNVASKAIIYTGYPPYTNLKNYYAIEFDIQSNTYDGAGSVFINGRDYGNIWKYSNINAREKIPQHIFIPINSLDANNDLTYIEIGAQAKSEILIDNLVLTPKSANTKQFFCAATFGSWVSDLDPVNPSPTFFTEQDAYTNNYGKYMAACDAQYSYAWTGHMCCGDDTNQSNYGEYFSDTQILFGRNGIGCFRGRPILEDQSVAEAYGYYEKPKDNNAMQLYEGYIFKDLLYQNDSFFACQANDTKYSNVKISFDGVFNNAASSVVNNKIIRDSCAVEGKYYCFNGAWRQYVPGLNQVRSSLTTTFDPAIPSQLGLKSVPSGKNLLQNGGFDSP